MSPSDIQEPEVQYIVRPLNERVSVLETQHEVMEDKLDKIIQKLDGLLELKYKGMGAIGLVSILIASASGVALIVSFIINIFNGKQA